MKCIENGRARATAMGLLLAVSVMLASCATTPATGPAGGGSPSRAPAVGLNNGRLKVYVTDQYGQPLDRSTVEVRSLSDSSVRRSAATDMQGTVTLTGLPSRNDGTSVRLQLTITTRNNGYYSEPVELQAAGTETHVAVQTTAAPR